MTTNILSLPIADIEWALDNNEDWYWSIAYFQADGVTPISIAGISFSGLLRVPGTSNAGILPFSTDNRLLITGGPFGNILGWVVPVGIINNIQANTYPYDVIAQADGVTRRLIFGNVVLGQGITQP